VTLGASTLNTLTGAGTNLSIASGTQTTTVNAALNNITALALGSTAQRGTMTVNNVITAKSLVTSTANYALTLNNGSSKTSTIGTSGSTAYALSFLNTGALVINNEGNDTFIVLGSLTASAPSSVTVSGTILTAGDLTIGSPLTMTTNVTLNSAGDSTGGGTGPGSPIAVTGGITAAASTALTLNAGSGSLTLSGAVASSGGAATLQVIIADTQSGATGFNGNLSLKSLATGSGAYDLSITGASNTIADALLFNLPRHANHHLQPSLNCDQLTHTPASPQMPTGYAGMVLLTFIPPLYKKIMTPRLPTPLAENAIFMKDQHGS
jgi:hypothetical protein